MNVMDYTNRNSLIHRLHPLTKMGWAVVILILSMVFTDPLYLVGVLISVVLVGLVGKVIKETLVYLTAIFFIGLIVFVLQIAFRPSGPVLFTVTPESWRAFGGWFPVTEGGLRYGISMGLRMLCLVSVFPVILTTTQPRDIVMALVEKLYVPYEYAFMFTTALRFMPVIMSEVTTISEAQRSRAYAVEGWNPIRKMQAFAPIAMPIVFIAIGKADRLGLCMELRGYGNKNRTYLRQLHMTVADWVAVILLVAAVAISLWISSLGYGKIVL
jgi:energy-coupling factor transport system permease protein